MERSAAKSKGERMSKPWYLAPTKHRRLRVQRKIDKRDGFKTCGGRPAYPAGELGGPPSFWWVPTKRGARRARWMLESFIARFRGGMICWQTLVNGGKCVSTTFLGCDHSWEYFEDGQNMPVLWETMVFDVDSKGRFLGSDDFQQRYTSRGAAHRGHVETVGKYNLPKSGGILRVELAKDLSI